MADEKKIGDNSLINSILATRIEETPTKQVAEVELPEPEPKVVIDQLIENEKPKQVDYSEYEAEPAKVQVKGDAETKTGKPIEIPETSPERVAQRNKVTSKWGVRLYDKLQGLMSMFAYDRLNMPEVFIARRNELLKKVYDGKITDKEREELKQVNEVVDTFMSRRTTYHESVHMGQDLVDDVNELLEDILALSGKDINPVWILAALLLIQPVINLVTAFSHKMQNQKF